MQTSDLWNAYSTLHAGAIISEPEKWALIKMYRDGISKGSDWTQLIDAPLTAAEKATWQTYRETLQNIEFAYANPDDVIFPDPPTFTNAPPSPETLAFRADRQQLKDEYLATIAQLQNIENAVNPTNAQVIAAVKFLAKTLRLMLKLLAKLFT
jgi:hypothetical protein